MIFHDIYHIFYCPLESKMYLVNFDELFLVWLRNEAMFFLYLVLNSLWMKLQKQQQQQQPFVKHTEGN